MAEKTEISRVDEAIRVLEEDWLQGLFGYVDFLQAMKKIMLDNFTDNFGGRFLEYVIIELRRYL